MAKCVKFEGCNAQIKSLGGAPAQVFKDKIGDQEVTSIVMAFKPSEDDLKSLNAGGYIFYQVYTDVKPFILFTTDLEGKPNV